MSLIVDNIKWIMIVSGVLTLTMLQAVFAPHKSIASNFGETLQGDAATLVVRNWGLLIALGGATLIYGGLCETTDRHLILAYTGLGKLAFITLVLSHGGRYLSKGAGIAVVADTIMVALFAAYIFATHA